VLNEPILTVAIQYVNRFDYNMGFIDVGGEGEAYHSIEY
jgi:hypothetical protein